MFVTTSVTTLEQTSCRFAWWCFRWSGHVRSVHCALMWNSQIYTMTMRCDQMQQCRATECEKSSPHDARVMLSRKSCMTNEVSRIRCGKADFVSLRGKMVRIRSGCEQGRPTSLFCRRKETNGFCPRRLEEKYIGRRKEARQREMLILLLSEKE